jgi:hypothetical protein
MISVVKMTAVLEDYTAKRQRSVVRFLWAKGLNAKDIHKNLLHVYDGKCLSRKAVQNWVTNVFQMTKKLKWRRGSG